MKIGFDVDGVLANFFEGYEETIVEVTGRDLFPTRWPISVPQVWDWPQSFGYTKDEITKVWEFIRGNSDFWRKLSPLSGLSEARRFFFPRRFFPCGHTVYFITDRPGIYAQLQTQQWLSSWGFYLPSVLLSVSRLGKGCLVRGLDLEVFIDDKVENILDVQTYAPDCRAYLAPEYPYNLNHPLAHLVKRRAKTVHDVLKIENLNTL